MNRPDWAPPEIDVDRPAVARVYDYYLGGLHNFAVDREFAAQVLQAMPDLPTHAQENRAFLRRAVRFLTAQGIDQFVDLGSGIPTVGNVHEVAQRADADSRVVYVDWDPVAVAHSRAILDGNHRASVIAADLRQPGQVLDDPALRQLIDLDRPVAVLLVSVLHFVPDDQRPREIVSEFAKAVAPGSYLVISHASSEGQPEQAARLQALYNKSASPMRVRSRAEISALFGDLTLVDPGVVQMPLWRPDSSDDVGPDVESYPGYAGVARIG
ncbi:SAM-dependent methyltransferase [Micromonospora sp. NPDC049679]|uniref:SAM-dependent methyltransferase n=1 Tax=Micromonospora sp. NPDC049679 TaxID=3155920 RepID=UPI0033EFD5BB